MTMKRIEAPPGNGRPFYHIHRNDSGTFDIYLRPEVQPMPFENGFADYDIKVYVVKNVEPFEGLEEDIRARYDAWLSSAEEIYL